MDNRVIVGLHAGGEARYKRQSTIPGQWQPDPAYEGWLRWGWRQVKWAAFWVVAGFVILTVYGWRLP